MKSRIVKKIAALIIVLTMVLSVAGVSMAHGGPKAKVVYNLAGGSLNGSSAEWTNNCTIYDIGVYDWHPRGRIDFTLPVGIPTQAGFAFVGWLVNGTVYPSGTQLTRVIVDGYWSFPKIAKWHDVNVTAQWRALSKYAVTFENSNTTAGTLSGNTSFANIYDGTSWASAGIAVPGCTPNTGYLFGGWYEGETKINDGEWPTTITGSHTYTARWTQIPAAELDHYKLTYVISGTIGTENTPVAYDGYGEPMIETPGAIEGYNFIGWTPSPINWTLVDTVQEGDENPVMVSYYEATVYGEYTAMPIITAQYSLYSLLFRGYADGMLFWPADVINSDTQPEADGVPYLAGYEFLGWTPEDLNWAGASVSYIYQVMAAGEGDGTPEGNIQPPTVPYILEIPVYTITVNATFNQDVPAEPEIPTGVPATGDASWIVFAGIILLAGSAVGGYALIRRKDS